MAEGEKGGRSSRSWKFLPDLIIPGIISKQSKSSEHMFHVDRGPLIKTAPVKNSVIKRKVVLREQFDRRLTGWQRVGVLSSPTRLPDPPSTERQPAWAPCAPQNQRRFHFRDERTKRRGEAVWGGTQPAAGSQARRAVGLFQPGLRWCPILVIPLNQNVLLVIKTTHPPLQASSEGLRLQGPLWCPGHSGLMPTSYPGPHGDALGGVCLHFQEMPAEVS